MIRELGELYHPYELQHGQAHVAERFFGHIHTSLFEQPIEHVPLPPQPRRRRPPRLRQPDLMPVAA